MMHDVVVDLGTTGQSGVTGDVRIRQTTLCLLFRPSSDGGTPAFGLVRPAEGHLSQWIPAQGPLRGFDRNPLEIVGDDIVPAHFLSATEVLGREFGVLAGIAFGRVLSQVFEGEIFEGDRGISTQKRYHVVVCRVGPKTKLQPMCSTIAEARWVPGRLDPILEAMRYASQFKKDLVSRVWNELVLDDWSPLKSAI